MSNYQTQSAIPIIQCYPTYQSSFHLVQYKLTAIVGDYKGNLSSMIPGHDCGPIKPRLSARNQAILSGLIQLWNSGVN